MKANRVPSSLRSSFGVIWSSFGLEYGCPFTFLAKRIFVQKLGSTQVSLQSETPFP